MYFSLRGKRGTNARSALNNPWLARRVYVANPIAANQMESVWIATLLRPP